MSFDDMIRFRCEGELKRRFEAIAAAERRDSADLARIVFEDFVAAKEKEIATLRDRPNSPAAQGPGVAAADAAAAKILDRYPKRKRPKTQSQ